MRRRVCSSLAVVAVLASLASCDDDDDDCRVCCLCKNDNTDLEYRPDPASDCTSCAEQCQALADREFAGQEFDIHQEEPCPD